MKVEHRAVVIMLKRSSTCGIEWLFSTARLQIMSYFDQKACIVVYIRVIYTYKYIINIYKYNPSTRDFADFTIASPPRVL